MAALGAWGYVGCFSFFSNKNMTTGEGGMVTTDDASLASRVRLLRSHGMTSGTWKRHHERPADYDVLEPGWNYRFDEIRAAIGLVQLGRLERANARRTELTARYRRGLEGVPRVRIAFQEHMPATAAHLLPLLAEDVATRSWLVGKLSDAGVQTSHHFPPVHLFGHYRERFGYRPGTLPRTEDFAARQITLPLYPTMSEGDVDVVIGTILNALRDASSRSE